MKSIAITALKFVLAALVIYFAGRQLVVNWAEVSQYDWTLNPVLLAFSVIFHLITFVVFSKSWCILMTAFGYRIPVRYGFKVAYLTNLGRYIPGKIWPVFGMVYLLNQIDVKKEVAFASWGIATILGIPPAFLVAFITVYFHPEMVSKILGEGVGVGSLIALLVIFTASAVLIFWPQRTIALYNWTLRLLRRPPVKLKLDKKVALAVYLGYFVSWICYGISFYTLMHAVMDNPAIPVIAGIGAFVLAYEIGYLTVFAPGGLGARELVLITVLTPFLGPVAAGMAVAARIWNLVTEFIAALIALLIKFDKNKE